MFAADEKGKASKKILTSRCSWLVMTTLCASPSHVRWHRSWMHFFDRQILKTRNAHDEILAWVKHTGCVWNLHTGCVWKLGLVVFETWPFGLPQHTGCVWNFFWKSFKHNQCLKKKHWLVWKKNTGCVWNWFVWKFKKTHWLCLKLGPLVCRNFQRLKTSFVSKAVRRG